MALNLRQAFTVSLWVILLLFVAMTCLGCTVTMGDGGVVGARLNLGEVGLEFYHEAKETAGNAVIKMDIEKGFGTWIGFEYDSDGDGEADQTREAELSHNVEPGQADDSDGDGEADQTREAELSDSVEPDEADDGDVGDAADDDDG